ncbi:MAG: glycosyltransferase family 4 protein [Thermoguttaceae bacterium]|jgi:glycosyltransferase involved in cell wall biosynthesis
MKIVYLAAGAGGMYCGSCLHGNTLAAALLAAGHDCTQVPMYTPLRTDEQSVSSDRIAFGGINVYLQQHSAIFRHTPWAFDHLLDSPGLLRWATGRSAAVRPEQLGPLTVSMLEGEHGRQRKEVEKLVRWLADLRPDVVHLNNVMLVGVAHEIIRRLGVPVVCSLTGEDVFLERLPEPYHGQALALLRQRAGEVAALVAMNRYYAEFMAGYLRVPQERIRVIPPGLNLAGMSESSLSPWERARVRAAENEAKPSPPALLPKDEGRYGTEIGYLARVCPDKGLHQLADALKLLATDGDMPPVRVCAAGYLDPADRPYLAEIERQMADAGLADRFQYVGELDHAGKIAFLQSLDLFCLPTVYRESKGLSVFEAWANGVPAVLPAHGAFPEMIDDTGGGVLCEPNDPAALAAALKRMILDPDFAAECGRRAQQIVHQRYNAEVMARRMIELYKELAV